MKYQCVRTCLHFIGALGQAGTGVLGGAGRLGGTGLGGAGTLGGAGGVGGTGLGAGGYAAAKAAKYGT